MSEQKTREERRSALDDFAASMPQSSGELIPAQSQQPMQLFPTLPPVGERDERKVLQKVKALAAAAGEDWYYRYPVKNKRTGKTDWIEGPSIKLANDLARLYGNCDVDCRYIDLGNAFAFYARFTDRETGFSLTRPFQQRKSAAKIGGADDERREDMALQIGTSKAERNVVVNALQTFADFAFEEAKGALVDRIGRDLDRWRSTTIERVKGRVEIERVEAVIGRKAGDWLAPDIARVIAMMKAVADGMAALNETFPPLSVEEGEVVEEPGAALDRFAGADSEASPTPEKTGEPRQEAGGADDDGPAPPADDNRAGDMVDGEPGVGLPEQAVHQVAGAEGPVNPVAPKASAALLTEAIDKLIRLASDKAMSADERLEALTNAQTHWADRIGEDAARRIVTSAAGVARGDMEPADAKRLLRAMVP